MRESIKQIMIGWLCAVCMLSGFSAQAGMIGTEQLASSQARDSNLLTVESFMARADVREQLEIWGVEPAQAEARVASLSDTELQQLAQNIESQPAGSGALAVVGIVFVVLLILELVGVTNIFTRF